MCHPLHLEKAVPDPRGCPFLLSAPGRGTGGSGGALKPPGGLESEGQAGGAQWDRGFALQQPGQRWGWERGTQSTWRGGHRAPSLLLVDNRGSGCPGTLSLALSHISIINPTLLCTGDAAFNFLSPSPRRANERKRF